MLTFIYSTPFLFFALASVGMTSILVDGAIFLPLREFLRHRVERIEHRREHGKKVGWNFSEFFYSILTCYQCCGFWCGVFCGFLCLNVLKHGDPYDLFAIDSSPILLAVLLALLFLCGCTTSILSVLFAVLLDTSRTVMDFYRANTPQEHFHEHPEEPFPEQQASEPLDPNEELV